MGLIFKNQVISDKMQGKFLTTVETSANELV